jgi:HSP20 family protein
MRYREPRSWMWEEALEMLQTAERLQRRFFQVGLQQGAPCWEPPVDLYERGGDLGLLVALPGVSPGDLEVAIEPGGVIVVRGERRFPEDYERAAIHRLEIPYGRFERHVALPGGRFQLIEKRLENGCLTLKLRRLT